MTAGIVIGEAARTRAVVAALRPHVRMLLCSHDEQDVADILRALRA
jgi:hypothetical protein